MDKLDLELLTSHDWTGKKIGLLGGSFNPAHEAHVEISLCALKKLDLDAIWWLVSPQNPLKSPDDMAPLGDRMAGARNIAPNPLIHVTDLERHLGSSYTAETLGKLTQMMPDSHFVWLMGADNLVQFSEWKDWQKIATTVVFAIFNRPGYSNAIETSEAARLFRNYQIPEEEAATLATKSAPAWLFIRDMQNPLSSTEMRRKKL